jgi:hypothetical protein
MEKDEMLRTTEEHEMRQDQMRTLNKAKGEPTRLLTPKDAAQLLNVSLSTVYALVRDEPGVHRIFTRKGNKKPTIRIEPQVIERILRRSEPLPGRQGVGKPFAI